MTLIPRALEILALSTTTGDACPETPPSNLPSRLAPSAAARKTPTLATYAGEGRGGWRSVVTRYVHP